MRDIPEKAEFIGGGPHDCAALAEFFAAVFESLAEKPRAVRATVDLRGAGELSLDSRNGEIEIRGMDGECSRRDFRRRWIAEHPVPLVLRGRTILRFTPVAGGRTRVER